MRWVAHLLPSAMRTNLPPSVMSDRGPSLGFAVVRERTLFCPHPQPLSHAVGEGSRAFPLSRPAGEGDTGGEGNPARLPATLPLGKNRACPQDSLPNCRTPVMPIAEPEFIVAPLLQVPPASRGEPRSALVRFPLLAGGTLRRGFSFIRAFTNFGCAIGIRGVKNQRPCRAALFAWILLVVACVATAHEPLVVEAEGVAEWKPPYEQAIREATRDALRQAVEQACGVRLARLEVGRDGVLEQSAQLAFAQGIALRWQMLGEPRRQNGCVYVRVRAEVMPLERLQTPADWREVWQTVGHPPVRLVVRYTGEIALEGRARQSLQAALRQSLGEMGVRPTEQADPGAWQLIAELELEPITRWGDASAPYGLGDQFASWQARLQLLAHAPNSRKPVLLTQRTAKGVSLVSDADAAQRAIRAVLTQPDAHWRTTLATLWVEQILNRPDETLKNNSIQPQSAKKEVANHAKTRTDRNRAATHRKPTRTRANRN